MNALNTHITTMSGAQSLAKASLFTLLGGGTMGQLKEQNMMKADQVTNDDDLVAAFNISKWNSVFYSNDTIKKRIMTETVNASRRTSRGAARPGGRHPLPAALRSPTA